MILGKNEITKLIKDEQLVTNYINLDEQIQPNGFDFTLKQVRCYNDSGFIFNDTEKKKPIIPDSEEVLLGSFTHDKLYEAWRLPRGMYKIIMNEIVKFPLDLIGRGMPRTSLLRSGATIESGIFDAGYEGPVVVYLNVNTSYPIYIQPDARVFHMAFEKLVAATIAYNGQYQKGKKV